MAIKNGNIADADEVMNSYGANFNDTAQIIFNSDYLGFDSRLANSGIPNLKNVFYSTFTTDDADTNIGFEYDSTNDLYFTINSQGTGSTESTQSIGDNTSSNSTFTSNFTANDDIIIRAIRIDSNAGGTLTVDIKQAGDTIATRNVAASSSISTTTFLDSDYSRIIESGQAFSIVVTHSTNVVFLKTGESFTGSLMTLTNGTLPGENGGSTVNITAEIAIDTSTEGTLIFKDTVASTDNAIAVINSQIDATSSQQISISVDGGSNFTDVENAEIARPVAGTALWRKIVIIRTDLTKIDKVTEQAVKFNFY